MPYSKVLINLKYALSPGFHGFQSEHIVEQIVHTFMTPSNHLSYITGLDGIRAVAVMGVLFYPANFPSALGGFLGVGTFLSFPVS